LLDVFNSLVTSSWDCCCERNVNASRRRFMDEDRGIR
jgi:hypothetical protein